MTPLRGVINDEWCVTSYHESGNVVTQPNIFRTHIWTIQMPEKVFARVEALRNLFGHNGMYVTIIGALR